MSDAERILYAVLDGENSFGSVEELRAWILNEWEGKDSEAATAAVKASTPPRNEWLEGVERRHENLGDGWARLPLTDFHGLLDTFKFGEGLLAEAKGKLAVQGAELVRVEARLRSQRVSMRSRIT